MKTAKLATLPLVVLLAACSHQDAPNTVATGASCSTLTGSEEALAEFYKPGTIYQATPLKERVFHARALQPEVVMGATLSVRAQPDMSAPYLQRVLACHTQSSDSAHPNDPLHPTSGAIASLSVDESKFGFRIHVRAENADVGEEIWARADALRNSSGEVQVRQVSSTTPSNGAF